MLFAVSECIGQAKWVLFRKGPENLIDFHNIDEASRSPRSAFLLVLRMRGRAVLASVGAVVFFLSLAVDPFIQQVLTYPTRSNLTSEYPPPTLSSVTAWNASGLADMGMSQQVHGDLCMSFLWNRVDIR